MALTQRLQIVLEAVGAGVVEKDFNKVAQSAGKLDAATGKNTKSLSGLVGSLGVSGGLAAGLAVAGGALVAFGAKSIGAFADATAQVRAFQRASGATAEDASRLVSAFKFVGISAEQGATSIFQLGKRLETSKDKLAAFGVSAVKDSKGNTDLAATLLSVADAYGATKDPAQRAALVTTAFGKAGQNLLPILAKGRVGIQGLFDFAGKTGQVFDQKQLDLGKEYSIAMKELGASTHQFALEFGEVLLPAVTDGIHLLTGLVNVTHSVGEAIGKVGGFLGKLNPGFDIFGHHVGLLDAGLTVATGGTYALYKGTYELGSALADSGDKASAAAAANQEIIGSYQQQLDAAKELETEVDKLQSVLLTSVGADRALNSARRSLTEATQQQKDAQKDLAALLKEGPVDLKKVADATRDVASANHELEKANQDVAAAQEKVAAVTKELGDLFTGKAAADAAAAAGDDLTAAQLRLRRAQNSQIAAQQRQVAVMGDAESTSLDLSNAQLDVEQSALDLKAATDDVTAAQAALSIAEKVGAENSQETIDKRAELKKANDDVTIATDAVTAASQTLAEKQAELTAAQAGDPEFQDKVAKARHDVASATQGVADATFDLSQKSFDAKVKLDELQTALGENEAAAVDLQGRLQDMAKDPALAGFLAGPLSALKDFKDLTGDIASVLKVPAGPAGSGLARGDVGLVGQGLFGGLFGGGVPPVVVNVAGSVLTDQDLVNKIVQGINEQYKRGGQRLIGLN